MRKVLMLLALGTLLLVGCQPKKEEWKVDPNDPTSVENSSKNEPVPMRSDGVPLEQGGGAPEPPAKQ